MAPPWPTYAAISGGHTLKARNVTLTGNFELNRNIKVTFDGLNSDFATVNGCTVVKGVLKLRSGRLNLKNLDPVRTTLDQGGGIDDRTQASDAHFVRVYVDL